MSLANRWSLDIVRQEGDVEARQEELQQRGVFVLAKE